MSLIQVSSHLICLHSSDDEFGMSGRCGGAVISAVPLIWNSPPLAAAAVGVARLIVRLLSSGGAGPEKDGRELLRSSPVDLVPLPVAPAKRVPPPTTQFGSLRENRARWGGGGLSHSREGDHARPSCQPQHRRGESRAGARKALDFPPALSETEEDEALSKYIG